MKSKFGNVILNFKACVQEFLWDKWRTFMGIVVLFHRSIRIPIANRFNVWMGAKESKVPVEPVMIIWNEIEKIMMFEALKL